MAGKYADRFRHTQSAASHDVVDLGELDRGSTRDFDDHDRDEVNFLDPAPDRPWHRGWRFRLALVAVLLVGAGVGAYGWERWRVHETEIAARSEVDLFASALTLNYSSEDQVSVAIEYQNGGPHEIVIRDARLDNDNVVQLRDPSVLEIAPGETGTHILNLRAECPDGVASSLERPALLVTVETIDGAVREQVVRADPIGTEVMEWYSYACMVGSYEPAFSETYSEFTAVSRSPDGTAVRAVVNFGFEAGTRLQISGVEPGSAAFAVEYTLGDHGSSPGVFGPFMTIELRIADCALALAATEEDMALDIAGAVEGAKPGELTAFPSPALAIELSRLAYSSCTG